MDKHLAPLIVAAFALTACDSTNQWVDKLLGKAEKTASTEMITVESNAPKIVAWMTLGAVKDSDKRRLSGQVSAAEATQLAFESNGQIRSIAVKLGQAFSQGQTLATLSDKDYRLQLQQAKANFTAAVATRDQARTDLRRRERLVKPGAVSKAQVDAYRLQLKSAQENVNTADAQVKLANRQLNKTDLIAPFDGVVTAKLGEIGQLASPSTPIFTVEATQAPEISITVPENLIASVKINQTVTVSFPARQDIPPLEGTVTAISTQASLGAFPVKIALRHAPNSVKAGMTAEVELPQPVTTGGFYIPPSALGAGHNNRHFVYRIVGRSTDLSLQKVRVSVDNLAGKTIRVRGNLVAGDKIVRSGLGFLSPQQPVRLMNVGVKTVNP